MGIGNVNKAKEVVGHKTYNGGNLPVGRQIIYATFFNEQIFTRLDFLPFMKETRFKTYSANTSNHPGEIF